MNEITVTIPAQTYNSEKYIGVGQRCYLEEALDKLGYKNSVVFSSGRTLIGRDRYKPSESTPFNYIICKESFNAGKDITITLIKQ